MLLLSFLFGLHKRHKRIGVPVPQSMLLFQPGNQFHMFAALSGADHVEPFFNRPSIFLFDGWS